MGQKVDRLLMNLMIWEMLMKFGKHILPMVKLTRESRVLYKIQEPGGIPSNQQVHTDGLVGNPRW
jgi:hypothetical protein